MRNLVSLGHVNSLPFSIFSDLENDLEKVFKSEKNTAFIPRCDISEAEGQYLLSLDVPGVKKEDINIEVIENQIKISGKRENTFTDSFHIEKKYGEFERSMALPQDVKKDSISATFKDGVLEIKLEKQEKVLPKKIQIS
jgi:HSP20 family protein